MFVEANVELDEEVVIFIPNAECIRRLSILLDTTNPRTIGK